MYHLRAPSFRLFPGERVGKREPQRTKSRGQRPSIASRKRLDMSAAQDGNLHRLAFPQFPRASDPLVVAMLYNRNGMAAWCWEAAHALHEQGRSVILIASADVPLPGIPEVEVVRVDT